MFKKFFKKIVIFLKKVINFLLGDNIKVSKKSYKIKPFMTNAEQCFYQKLLHLEECGNFKIVPQVNLASIIKKVSKERFQTELYRNVDFAIFDKSLTTLFLLIELNDNSHNTYRRKNRDKKVKEICENANIKLITFYNKYSNKSEYIIERVLKEINLIKEKTL